MLHSRQVVTEDPKMQLFPEMSEKRAMATTKGQIIKIFTRSTGKLLMWTSLDYTDVKRNRTILVIGK